MKSEEALKFRKRPVVVEAVQWFKHGDHPAVVRYLDTPEGIEKYSRSSARHWGSYAEEFPAIETPEGVMRVTEGDWIIRGIKGEFYPCKPDIFAATYEPADSLPAPGEAVPDWSNRNVNDLSGWINELGTLSQHPHGMPGWVRSAIETIYRGLYATAPPQVEEGEGDCHGLDTPERVRFYERDFYPLSNFSAFTLQWDGMRFDTSEAAYHYEKFRYTSHNRLRGEIRWAASAHEAFKIAERNKHLRRPDWDEIKLDVMRAILRAKVDQHEYVRRKLLATGDRLLVEDSWRDDYWGWGPNRDGQNWLGRLWMELRDQLKAAHAARGG